MHGASSHKAMSGRMSGMYALGCATLQRAGLLDWLLRQQRGGVLVLMYHGIRVRAGAGGLTNYAHKNVERDEFAQQMRLLASRCNVIGMSEAAERLASSAPLGPRTVVVTFDDGYRNNYDYAWPICRELGIPFTLYVVTGFVERQAPLWMDRVEFGLRNTARTELEVEIGGQTYRHPLRTHAERDRADADLRRALKPLTGPPLADKLAELEALLCAGPKGAELDALSPCTPDMLREMAGSGLVEIGAHMVSHESVARMRPADAAADLRRAKGTIEAWVGRPCRHFAYPFGRSTDFSSATEALVRGAGYASAVTTVEGVNRPPSNVFALRRVGVYGHYMQPEFLAAITGVHTSLSGLRHRFGLRSKTPRADFAR
jgi:peptidoglycan/xylan/chitin deacetylase (PgdA/CDA1 family)